MWCEGRIGRPSEQRLLCHGGEQGERQRPRRVGGGHGGSSRGEREGQGCEPHAEHECATEACPIGRDRRRERRGEHGRQRECEAHGATGGAEGGKPEARDEQPGRGECHGDGERR